MTEILTFFKENPKFFIATMDGDQPRVRPFGAITYFEDNLYICTSNQKRVFKQILENPKIELCGITKDGNSWLRVQAVAVLDSRREARVAMLADNPDLKKIYHPDDGLFEVLYLKNVIATFCEFGHAPSTVTY